jgi:hypothetical protein
MSAALADPMAAVAGLVFVAPEVSRRAAKIVLTDDNFATLHGEAEDVWAERVRLLAPCQVNADLMRRTRHPAVKAVFFATLG